MRVLIVEDTHRLRETLTDGLRAAGYAVDAVSDGRRGLIHARTTEYDLIVLDIMLPELDGLSLLARLRKAGATTPVLVLSARDRV
ncbi:MAG: response regulator, partial [Phycisphaerales bacterium]|nr:response regulator [Phycisphaerales bacterium]